MKEKTVIDWKILAVLTNGIVIRDKKLEFLVFSSSQLRSTFVWMYISDDKDVRHG